MSSRGSFDGPSQVSSPLSLLESQSSNDAWGVLYVAVGQVVRMKRHEEGREEGCEMPISWKNSIFGFTMVSDLETSRLGNFPMRTAIWATSKLWDFRILNTESGFLVDLNWGSFLEAKSAAFGDSSQTTR